MGLSRPVGPALRVHGLVFEVLLIGLTWKNTKTTRRDVGIRTPFSTMFLRNGTSSTYFLGLKHGLVCLIRYFGAAGTMYFLYALPSKCFGYFAFFAENNAWIGL